MGVPGKKLMEMCKLERTLQISQATSLLLEKEAAAAAAATAAAAAATAAAAAVQQHEREEDMMLMLLQCSKRKISKIAKRSVVYFNPEAKPKRNKFGDNKFGDGIGVDLMGWRDDDTVDSDPGFSSQVYDDGIGLDLMGGRDDEYFEGTLVVPPTMW